MKTVGNFLGNQSGSAHADVSSFNQGTATSSDPFATLSPPKNESLGFKSGGRGAEFVRSLGDASMAEETFSPRYDRSTYASPTGAAPISSGGSLGVTHPSLASGDGMAVVVGETAAVPWYHKVLEYAREVSLIFVGFVDGYVNRMMPRDWETFFAGTHDLISEKGMGRKMAALFYGIPDEAAHKKAQKHEDGRRIHEEKLKHQEIVGVLGEIRDKL